MITTLLVTLVTVGGTFAFLGLKSAPEGYEDESGFHYFTQSNAAAPIRAFERARNALTRLEGIKSLTPLFRRELLH
jgi:hypothetical protein